MYPGLEISRKSLKKVVSNVIVKKNYTKILFDKNLYFISIMVNFIAFFSIIILCYQRIYNNSLNRN